MNGEALERVYFIRQKDPDWRTPVLRPQHLGREHPGDAERVQFCVSPHARFGIPRRLPRHSAISGNPDTFTPGEVRGCIFPSRLPETSPPKPGNDRGSRMRNERKT